MGSLSLSTSRYHVVQTYEGAEANVVDAFTKKLGFDSFYPHAVTTVRQRFRGHVTKLQPVFPEYVFVQFDRHIDKWARIAQVRGVVGILSSCDGDPLPVPDAHIVDIREAHLTGAYQRELYPQRLPYGVKAGDQLRIVHPESATNLSSPFEGHEGQCVYTRKGRVDVRLSLFGRSTVVHLDRAQVVPVGALCGNSLHTVGARV